MLCPSCCSPKLRIVKTKTFDTVVFRVRLCSECNWSWTTQEECCDERGHKIRKENCRPIVTDSK